MQLQFSDLKVHICSFFNLKLKLKVLDINLYNKLWRKTFRLTKS